jgi:hypothetical protein
MLHPEGIKKRPKLDNIVLNDPSVKKSKNHDMTSKSLVAVLLLFNVH